MPTEELREKLEMEVADVLLYALHLCDHLGVLPQHICMAKIEEIVNVRKPDWVEGFERFLP